MKKVKSSIPGKSTHCHRILFTSPSTLFFCIAAAAIAQSCLTLSDPMDCSLPGSSIHGIFQARLLEWGAIAFSNSLLAIQYFLQFLLGWHTKGKINKWYSYKLPSFVTFLWDKRIWFAWNKKFCGLQKNTLSHLLFLTWCALVCACSVTKFCLTFVTP